MGTEPGLTNEDWQAIITLINACKTQTLKLFDRGLAVAILQQRLRDLGYGVLPVFGWWSMFGGITLYRVKQFQKEKNLPVTGVVGPETWNALFP